jgi:hypothetical protein
MVDTTNTNGSRDVASAPSVEAGAPEITVAMIEAGLRVYRDNERDDLSNRDVGVIVREIFTAMFLASNCAS